MAVGIYLTATPTLYTSYVEFKVSLMVFTTSKITPEK